MLDIRWWIWKVRLYVFIYTNICVTIFVTLCVNVFDYIFIYVQPSFYCWNVFKSSIKNGRGCCAVKPPNCLSHGLHILVQWQWIPFVGARHHWCPAAVSPFVYQHYFSSELCNILWGARSLQWVAWQCFSRHFQPDSTIQSSLWYDWLWSSWKVIKNIPMLI